jgi:signal transduction histidine kinase
VSVEDDGPGIPEAEVSHVFDRFYTGVRPAARQRGSGLGLAIVRELSEAMGATAEAEPGRDGGARMTVHLSPWVQTRNEGP